MLRALVLLWLAPLLVAGAASAGTFVFADETNGIDIVTHPEGYTGIGGEVRIDVCIDPTSVHAAEMVTSVRNVIRAWNQLTPTTGNLVFGASNNIPSSGVDFESMLLHELGHCIGLGHPNLGTESGVTGDDQNYTKSTNGSDGFDLGIGTDGVRGSSDDQRGDDVNLHWFRRSNNNPFTIASVVDSTTYARDVARLPSGHAFAANADRDVGALLGFANTESVMQQGIFVDEAQRTLNHDDVATLRYARSGLNEQAGTADDYTIVLVDGGMGTQGDGCEIVIDFDDSETDLAVCATAGAFIGASRHVAISSADIFFNNGFNWFFNDQAAGATPTPAPGSTATPAGTPTPTPGAACGGVNPACPSGQVCIGFPVGTCQIPTPTPGPPATATPTGTPAPPPTPTPAAALNVERSGNVTIEQGRSASAGTFRLSNTSDQELSVAAVSLRVGTPALFTSMTVEALSGQETRSAFASPPNGTTVFTFDPPLPVAAGGTATFDLEVSAASGSPEAALSVVVTYASILPLSAARTHRDSAVPLALFSLWLLVSAAPRSASPWRRRLSVCPLLGLTVALLAAQPGCGGGGGSAGLPSSTQTVSALSATSEESAVTVSGLPTTLGTVKVRPAPAS